MGLQVGAWQPNGRHLYVAQQTPSGPRVMLFETNGLQHGGFDVGPSGVHHQAVAGNFYAAAVQRSSEAHVCTLHHGGGTGITVSWGRCTMS
jgi:IKI3 family